jgi:hypothetical protein
MPDERRPIAPVPFTDGTVRPVYEDAEGRRFVSDGEVLRDVSSPGRRRRAGNRGEVRARSSRFAGVIRRAPVSFREESRPLAGFYPDPEQCYSVHCTFAHRFLPKYVHENPRAFFYGRYGGSAGGSSPADCTRFIHSRWRIMEGMIAGAPTVCPVSAGAGTLLV